MLALADETFGHGDISFHLDLALGLLRLNMEIGDMTELYRHSKHKVRAWNQYVLETSGLRAQTSFSSWWMRWQIVSLTLA